MKKAIIFLLCMLTVACLLSGCKKSNAEQPQTEPAQTTTTPQVIEPAEEATEYEDELQPETTATQTSEPTEDEDEPQTEPTKKPSEHEDGLNADELLRIRFTAKQPATAKQIEEYLLNQETTDVVSGKAEIPEELLESLCKAIDDGTDEEFINSHSTGTELSLDELPNLTGSNYRPTEAVAFRADMDNDGKEDIISHIFGGGTSGFAEIKLLSYNDDGWEVATVADIYQPTSVLQWEDKNYLCVKEYDYNSKKWLGYTIYAFADAGVAAISSVSKTITGYTSEIINSDTSYPGIEQVKTTLNNDKMPSILDYNDGVIYGTAEEANESLTKFSSDIDNDGTVETYTKRMFYPSNTYTHPYCECDEPVSTIVNREENKDAGVLYTFWVDKVDSDNILYLYFNNDDGFELCAYKLSA